MAANGKVANGKVADGKASTGKVANGKASNGNVSVESSKGPWAECAACSAQGPRPQNEDVHVMLCTGLPEGPAPNIKAAGLPGLFDDLPEMVSGPSLPEKPSDHSERCPEWLGRGFRMISCFFDLMATEVMVMLMVMLVIHILWSIGVSISTLPPTSYWLMTSTYITRL